MNTDIKPDSDLGQRIGFTSDKFRGKIWLDEENYINIMEIRSHHPGKGNFSKMLQKIEQAGYGIKMITPLPQMEAIIKHKGGFTKVKWESYECPEWAHLWIKESPQEKHDAQI